MIMKIEVNTDDFDERFAIEDLLNNSLEKIIKKSLGEKLVSDQFKRLADAAEEAVMANIKMKMESFLSEEIVITGRWGEKDFVGSIDDLIKSRFDAILLKSVDDNGKELKGCPTKEQTWIEWRIGKELEKTRKDILTEASRKISQEVSTSISDQLLEMKNNQIKNQVAKTLGEILK